MMKDSFVFYLSQYDAIKELNNEQLGRLFRALFEKQLGHEVVLENDIKIAFNFIIGQIEKDSQKWEETRKKRSEAGKKHSGNQYTNSTDEDEVEQNGTNGTNENTVEQNGTNGTVNVNVNDNVNVINTSVNNNTLVENSSDNSSESPTHANKAETNSDLLADFDKIWNEYPRKDGKGDAFRHYKSWLNGKAYAGTKVKLTNKQMWYAVVDYAEYVEKNQIEKRYVKMGSSFFNSTIMDYVKPEEELNDSS